jgi:hypothetical protein
MDSSSVDPGGWLWTVIALALIMVGVIAGKIVAAMTKGRWPWAK